MHKCYTWSKTSKGLPLPLSQSMAWCAFIHKKWVSFAREENLISQERMSTTTRFEKEPKSKLGNRLLQRHNRPFHVFFFQLSTKERLLSSANSTKTLRRRNLKAQGMFKLRWLDWIFLGGTPPKFEHFNAWVKIWSRYDPGFITIGVALAK